LSAVASRSNNTSISVGVITSGGQMATLLIYG
jgi:hypothetical protein